MTRKISFLLPFFSTLLIISLLIGYAHGNGVGGISDFTCDYQINDWDECSWNSTGASRLNISSHAPDEGDSRWIQADYPDPPNPAFYGYYARIDFLYLNAEGEWWEVQKEKSVTLMWNFSNVYFNVKWTNIINWGGWLNNWWFNYGCSTNCSSFTGDWYNFVSAHFAGREHWNYDNDIFDFYVERLNETQVSMTLFKGITDGWTYDMEYVFGANVTVDSGFWDDATVSFQVGHSGNGRFSATMDNTVNSVAPPIPPSDYTIGGNENLFVTFASNLYHFSTAILPPSWKSSIDTIVGYGGYFGAIVGALLVALGCIIPMLPLILVFAMLGVGLTCVSDGTFEPARDFVGQIISLSSGVVDTLINIGHTIYDFIHFW